MKKLNRTSMGSELNKKSNTNGRYSKKEKNEPIHLLEIKSSGVIFPKEHGSTGSVEY